MEKAGNRTGIEKITKLKVVKSFLAGGRRQEGVNPCLCSVGGAASGCGMPPVQVWGVNLCAE